MNCISDHIIQKFIDGECDAQEEDRIKKHVAKCAKCAAKINEQKENASLVKNAINALMEDDKRIPKFIAPQKTKQLVLNSRKLFYGLAAACVLFAFLMVNPFLKTEKEPDTAIEISLMESIELEYDANQPLSQQELVINIIDPEGNVSEYVVQ